eukprot:3799839-Prorocentrum_lima.AAC.1
MPRQNTSGSMCAALHPHPPLSRLFYHEMRRIAEQRRKPYMLTDWEPSEEPSARMRDAFYDATVVQPMADSEAA